MLKQWGSGRAFELGIVGAIFFIERFGLFVLFFMVLDDISQIIVLLIFTFVAFLLSKYKVLLYLFLLNALFTRALLFLE